MVARLKALHRTITVEEAKSKLESVRDGRRRSRLAGGVGSGEHGTQDRPVLPVTIEGESGTPPKSFRGSSKMTNGNHQRARSAFTIEERAIADWMQSGGMRIYR